MALNDTFKILEKKSNLFDTDLQLIFFVNGYAIYYLYFGESRHIKRKGKTEY